jgi:hypothetical protein
MESTFGRTNNYSASDGEFFSQCVRPNALPSRVIEVRSVSVATGGANSYRCALKGLIRLNTSYCERFEAKAAHF